MDQPGNPVADAINSFSKLAPLVFKQTENSSTSADPAALARSNDLINLLVGRGTSTSAADGVIQDILYRAQLAFTPVLGAEKTAGIYNSTTKAQLAEDAVNRAAAASAQAVAQMQSEALAQAAAITNANTKATSKTQATKQPAVPIENLLAGAGVSIGAGEAYKKLKSLFAADPAAKAKAASDNLAATQGSEYGDASTAGSIDSVDTAAFGPVDAGNVGTSAGAGDMFSAAGYDQAAIAENSVAPTFLDTSLVDQAAVTPLTALGVDGSGATGGSGLATDAAAGGATAAGISAMDAETIGPIGVQKAQEAYEAGDLGASGTGSVITTEGAAAGGADVLGLTAGNALALPTGAGMALNEDNMIGGTTDVVTNALGLGSVADAVKDIPIVGDVASAAKWIVCTELRRQQRLPQRFYVYGAKIFAAYPERYKSGYYIWAVPTVRHLRSKPNSLYSKFICTVFNWRAEYLAGIAGCKGARKNFRGWFSTSLSYYLCVILSQTIARKPIDWKKIYAAE